MLAIYNVIEFGRQNSFLNQHTTQQDIDDLLISAARISKGNGGNLTAAMEELVESSRLYGSSHLRRLDIVEAEEYDRDFGAEDGANQRVTIDLDGGTMRFEYGGQFRRRPEEVRSLPGSVAEPLKMARMAPTIRLKDLILLGLPPANVYLVHNRSDVGTIPASGLLELSDKGLAEFSDLLGAKVDAIRPGAYGIELVMTGILPERLEDFDRAQAAMLQAGPYLGLFQAAGQSGTEAPMACPEEAVQAVRDYLCFERDTTEIWPWFLSAEEILADESRLREIGTALHHDPEHGYDTDEIYQALTEAFGVNPALEQDQGQTMAP